MKPSIDARWASAVLQLVRWPNAVLAAAGAMLGAWWVRSTVSRPAFEAALAAVALTAAANAWNDVDDVVIDAIAHPRRPLPSGQLSIAHARGVAWCAATVALPLAALARPVLAALSVPVLVLMRMYSRHLKRRGIPGNVAVAVLASLPFLYGAWSVDAPGRGFELMAIAAPLHLAREIAKDLDDADADAAAARHTLAVRRVGAARAVLLAMVMTFLAVLTPIALHTPRFAAALAPAVLVLALAARRALAGQPGSPDLFKAAMVCAMAALAVARRGG